jgi:2-aminophenol/2-amino-5-chlorophenol 1,6-dioxygenase beta subunit
MNVDVELATQIHDKAHEAGLAVKMMTNPDFRVDYGTITTGHMFRPEWDKPLVVISSNRSRAYYSVEVMQEMMMELGRVTREAILESGKKVVVLASNSLSHRHFTTESKIPEDMSKEHITSHAMHLWDMRMIDYMKSGQCQRLIDEMPEFTEQAIAETDGGAFTWLLSTLEVPDYPAILHGYGTIIGTGNAIVEWPVYQHKGE